MRDERLCVHCGHRESDQVIIHDEEQGDVEYCEPCGAGHGVHPFEAAPSTDEGEARFDPDAVAAARVRFPDPEPVHGVPVKADVVYALQHAYIEGWETGRAPLEERIRALQTTNYRCEEVCEAAQYGGSCRCSLLSELPAAEARIRELEWALADTIRDARAETERLREALRPLVAAYDGGDLECPHFHSCPAHRDRVRNVGPCNCGAGEIEAAIEKARALATPPSSTEGTNEVEG